MKTCLLALGRFGDVINMLPLLWRANQQGDRMTCVVAQEFESVLDGVSYCDRLVWKGDYSRPDLALQWLRIQYPHFKVLIGQSYRSPLDKKRLTSSYQLEAWRLAGKLDEFGMWPTVFDKRDALREANVIVDGNVWPMEKPTILVGLSSVSSPLKNGPELLQTLRAVFGDSHNIVDLTTIKAERIYDVLGLMDRAVCLVTADTAWLHLARASRVPVVALISVGNVGKPDTWFGSVPPPNCIAATYYSLVSLDWLVRSVNHAIESPVKNSFIHIVHNHGSEVRHEKARATWTKATRFFLGRLMAVDDKPYFTSLLSQAANRADGEKVVIWSNSDIQFTEGAFEAISAHVQRWGACSIRRKETDNREGVHMGREVFAFTFAWLQNRLVEFPDFILGSPCFDLVLAALIRKTRGVPTTKENLHLDIFPCEMDTGLVLHEPHESAWLKDSPANEWNKKLARDWCAMEMTTLKL